MLLEMLNVEHSIKGELLFKQEHPVTVYRGDRIGIVGQNGAGKSTLMNMMTGREMPDKGSVTILGTTAIAAQLEDYDYTLSAKSESIWGIAQVEEAFMSGGERTRRKIAAAFEINPDILFLDEPTSHLDREGTVQLERELVQFQGAVLVISHDREFLDNVCSSILEINDGKIMQYSGHYSDYKKQKQAEESRKQYEYDEFVKEKARLTEAMKEKEKKVKSMSSKPTKLSNSEMKLGKGGFQSKKKSIDKTVKAMEKRIHRLEVKEKPHLKQPIVFDIQSFEPIHSKTALSIERLTCSAGSRRILNNVTLQLKPGQKCAVTGNNGTGKSTLLKAVVQNDTPAVRLSLRAEVGYFSQNLSVLNESRSILENVKDTSPYKEEFIRTVLARMLFKREDVHKPVSVLSGGERVKTALAKLLLGSYNFLVLDEPTNYLDVFTREALEDVLAAYPGTVLFAAHDRYLIEKVATHIFSIENGVGHLAAVEDIERKAGGNTESKEDILLLEMELTDIIGKISTAKTEEEKQALEERYHALVQSIQGLK
ncbi:ribosomal protection-like ABC-F family protein [Fictibacillus iocasae]|uniref:Ribosomal protection-like ABC-F family protein n=1 Tax=Fictibacillus iocasae TaxID=2715437 RepID=A0ABW2NY74_9BACL